MDTGLKNWVHKSHHMGTFGRYSMYAFQYEHGIETAWHVTAWPGANPVRDYWITNGRFFEVSIHYMYRGTNEIRIEIYGEIDVNQEEKSEILRAIAEWEQANRLPGS